MVPESITATHAFGIALKRARRAARLTQAQLAERAGFSVVYVSMLERGARAPQRTTLALLADALALSSTERAAWEGAVQLSADRATDRRRGGDGTSPLPIGAFLSALPSGPLVGREAELATIATAIETVAQGQGRLLLLVGEPGVGKTRLAQEITLLARSQGFRLLTGRCYEPQQSLAYAPFIEALAQAVPLTEAAALTPLAERWPEVARLLPDHAAPVPTVADDGAARQRLYYQLTGFLGTLVEQRPLAILVDDLHWADGASLELLQHLARHTRDQPMLLVGTTRAVEAERQHPLVDALRDLGRDELVEQLTLQPLATDETAALIGVTLGGADGALGDSGSVAAELAARIQARSEGNAFFTRQLARALQEQGNLTFSEGQWSLSGTTPAAFTPESIRAVIGQRLGRLTPHTQEVLREASVLGQVMGFDELQHMGHRGEQEVEEALEEAAEAGIIREGQRDQYHFNHALTRDTLYAELSARRKRRLHRAAADAIEQQPDHVRRVAELAYHLLAAEEGERALPYALLAGDQAEAVYAHAEAAGHYRTALNLARELDNRTLEARALKHLGKELHVLAQYDEAITLLGQSMDAYRAQGEVEQEGKVAQWWAEAHNRRGTPDQGYTRLRLLLADLIARGLSTAQQAHLQVRLAWLCMGSIECSDALNMAAHLHNFVSAAESALALARVEKNDALLAEATFTWGMMNEARGNHAEAVEALEAVIPLAEASGDLMSLSRATRAIAYSHESRGEFATSQLYCERALAIAERSGDPQQIALCWGALGGAAYLRGDWTQARGDFTHAITTLWSEPVTSMYWQCSLSLLYLAEGQEELAVQTMAEPLALAERIHSLDELRMTHSVLAERDVLAGRPAEAHARLEPLLEPHGHCVLPALAWACLELGEVAQAEAFIRESRERAIAQEDRLLLLDALRTQAMIAARCGRYQEATQDVNEALALCQAMPYPYAEAKTLWVYGQLDAARGNPVAARKRFKQALTICDRLSEGLYRKYIERDLRHLAQKV